LKSRRSVNDNTGKLDDEHYSLGSDSDEAADDGQSRRPPDGDRGLDRS